jgi:hypothetical protein
LAESASVVASVCPSCGASFPASPTVASFPPSGVPPSTASPAASKPDEQVPCFDPQSRPSSDDGGLALQLAIPIGAAVIKPIAMTMRSTGVTFLSEHELGGAFASSPLEPWYASRGS